MSPRVIFRADGNSSIGYGHFVRSLGVADLIKDEFDCIFAIKQPTDYQLKEIKNVCKDVIILEDSDNHFDQFLNYLQVEDIVFLDNYFFDDNYQLKIKKKSKKLIFVDDYNDKNYVCDVLINNIPGFMPNSFKTNGNTKLCLGIDYALLRKEFFDKNLRKINKNKNSFFIAFGGSDIFNISLKIITFLKEIDSSFEINLLIGDSYQYLQKLEKYNSVRVHKNISANKVANLIAKSEYCIVPSSSLLNETACIGSKVLTGYFADNQIQPYNYFVNNNLAIGLKDFRTLNSEIFNSKLNELIKSEFLIENQRKIYRFQQQENLINIFRNIDL